jgi:predicted RNase H-like HicB family nuclease
MATDLVYKVLLHKNEEGIAVQCPALPGCWSQGENEAEALENIADAIREYLAAIEARTTEGESREVRVAV